MTISFGSCEVRNGQSGVTLWDTLFSTAAAEGISVFVSSGDSGAAGCDGAFANPPAVSSQYADSPNVICVSSYATCVGGTEFAEGTGTYWNTTNASNKESALSYIPEGGWNEPTTTYTTSGFWPASSGGGPSIYVAKPTWQVATGVPSDGARDTPDIAFSGAGHDSYYVCQDDALGPYITAGQIPATASCATAGGGYFFGSYGTSAASPGMAGLMALINSKLGKAQGNFNPLLYKTYAATPSAFHDTTIASSGVANCSTATPSMCNNSIPGSASLTTGAQIGYSLQTGYDLVTGLGSLDVAAFLTATGTTPTISTTTTVTASPNPASTGQTVTLSATLKPNATGTTTPTGTINFYSNGAAIGSAVTIANNTATTTTTFATAGTYAITAVYSGDSTYITSTATAVNLVVAATPNFTLTAATPAGTYISGSTTTNTDLITITSTNSFAGSVALNCATTGITGATCTLTPTPVAVTANAAPTSTLTITTPTGTSGTLTVTVTGTSGTLTSSVAVNFTVALPTFTITPAASTLTFVSGSTGATDVITLKSAATIGYSGTVSLVCSTTLPTGTITNGTSAACTVSPTTVTIAAGGTATATITVTSSLGNSGTFSATVVGTRTFAGGAANTLNADPNTVVAVTVTGAGFTLSTPSNLTLVSGATTGNTTTSTVTSTNGFAGTVTFGCTIVGSAPAYPPTCTASPVTLTAGSTAPTTITVASTTAVSAANHVPENLNFGLRSGGATLASLFFMVAFRRRKTFRALAALAFLAIGFTALSGCSGGGTPPKTIKSSAGSYTVTVTGTGTTTGSTVSATGSTSFTLTIN